MYLSAVQTQTRDKGDGGNITTGFSSEDSRMEPGKANEKLYPSLQGGLFHKEQKGILHDSKSK